MDRRRPRARPAPAAQRGGAIRDHMSTANVARDMDVLRELVGDAQLTYAGVSYGSYLGVTYANLFPGRVRALVVDGVLDPIAWSTGRSAVEGCAGPVLHPPAQRRRRPGHAAGVLPAVRRGRAALRVLRRRRRAVRRARPQAAARAGRGRLRRRPDRDRRLHGPDRHLARRDVRLLRSGRTSRSFSPSSRRSARRRGSRRTIRARRDATAATLRRHRGDYQNFLEGVPGRRLRGQRQPTHYAAWSINGALADAQFGYFGRLWTWASSICAEWPGRDEDRYLGPWNRVDRQPGAGRRQPLRPGHPLRGRADGATTCCRARRC